MPCCLSTAPSRQVAAHLNAEKRPGTYICAACNQPLFDAAHKYESGTGWPSYWQPLPNAIGTSTDYKLIYPRTEYHCARCGGHQGHVFNDGLHNPQASGIATTVWRLLLCPKMNVCLH